MSEFELIGIIQESIAQIAMLVGQIIAISFAIHHRRHRGTAGHRS
jgi:hypothetical protein